VKGGECLDQVSDYEILKDSAALNRFWKIIGN
jgi:hypothetical protein